MNNLKDLKVGQHFRFFVDAHFGLSTCIYKVIEHRDSGALVRAVYYLDNFLGLHDCEYEEEVFSYDSFIVFPYNFISK